MDEYRMEQSLFDLGDSYGEEWREKLQPAALHGRKAHRNRKAICVMIINGSGIL